MIKIAHLSDLHFSKIKISPKILFSKQSIGMLNLLLNRSKCYRHFHLKDLPDFFKTLNVDHMLITGDFTSTSLIEEFIMAKNFLENFDEKIKTLIIPGNHDNYTKKAFKNKLFSTFLQKSEKKQVDSISLSDKWHCIGIDTTLPTPLFSCWGLFSEDIEKELIENLNSIPKEKNIIVINHYPLIHNTSKRKILKRRARLYQLLKNYPNVKLYLHGHTHKWEITKNDNSPYMICCGCTSYINNSTFNILELTDSSCKVINYLWNGSFWQENKIEKLKL